MVFMKGSPGYPCEDTSMYIINVFREHYPWILYNRTKPELQLQYYDITRDEGIQYDLLKYAKFGEIP